MNFAKSFGSQTCVVSSLSSAIHIFLFILFLNSNIFCLICGYLYVRFTLKKYDSPIQYQSFSSQAVGLTDLLN